MNKKDIMLEVQYRSKELLEWAGRIESASPALAAFFRDRAGYIRSAKYDSYGATMMAGRVDGLTMAAGILLEERMRHHGDI